MKEKERDIPLTEEKKETAYSKEQLIMSKKYKDRNDMLSALLEEDKQYTIKQAEEIMENYKKRRVN